MPSWKPRRYWVWAVCLLYLSRIHETKNPQLFKKVPARPADVKSHATQRISESAEKGLREAGFVAVHKAKVQQA
jgi:hypothetical protein